MGERVPPGKQKDLKGSPLVARKQAISRDRKNISRQMEDGLKFFGKPIKK